METHTKTFHGIAPDTGAVPLKVITIHYWDSLGDTPKLFCFFDSKLSISIIPTTGVPCDVVNDSVIFRNEVKNEVFGTHHRVPGRLRVGIDL
jgi:hypothetical protein